MAVAREKYRFVQRAPREPVVTWMVDENKGDTREMYFAGVLRCQIRDAQTMTPHVFQDGANWGKVMRSDGSSENLGTNVVGSLWKYYKN